MKKFISTLLSLIMILSSAATVFADTATNNEEALNFSIREIEAELYEKGYTVNSAMEKYIENLNSEKNKLSDSDEILKIQI